MRLIDAEAFEKFIEKQDESADYERCRFEEWLEQQPTIEAKPVVHAHWEGGTCLHCKLSWDDGMVDNADDWGYFDPMPAYCLNCGAQMDEEVQDDV